jgi:hypothetical protein
MILNNQLVNKNLMLYKKPITLLSSKNNYNEIKIRNMQATCHVLKKIRVNNTMICTNNPGTFIQNRGYVSAHAGKLILPKKNIPQATKAPEKFTASCDNIAPIKSDMKGHSVGVLAVCKEPNCKNTNCAEGSIETNPCKVSGETHQEPLFISNALENAGIVAEMNGALTHKIPKGCEGTLLNDFDMEGIKANQYIMREVGVIPLKKEQFAENPNKTAYLQQTEITGHMIQNASPNSVMNLNNKQPSTLLAKNNTPLDENL